MPWCMCQRTKKQTRMCILNCSVLSSWSCRSCMLVTISKKNGIFQKLVSGMSNSSRGTISCTRVLTPHSIAHVYQHIHAGVIFQHQSPFIFFTYNSKRTRIWQFHAQNKKLYFRSEKAFRMWKCFFVILQVRIPVAGASQETRVESHPPYSNQQGTLHTDNMKQKPASRAVMFRVHVAWGLRLLSCLCLVKLMPTLQSLC